MGDYREKESVRGKTQNVEEEGEGEEHGQVVKSWITKHLNYDT